MIYALRWRPRASEGVVVALPTRGSTRNSGELPILLLWLLGHLVFANIHDGILLSEISHRSPHILGRTALKGGPAYDVWCQIVKFTVPLIYNTFIPGRSNTV